jgi:hypothetical protein
MYPTFQEQYRHAREDQVEAYVDEMVEIADNQSEDAKSRQVRINARIWAASKIKPKKYGDVPAVLVDNRQQLMVVMPTTGEATKARLLQAPAIEAEIVEPEE